MLGILRTWLDILHAGRAGTGWLLGSRMRAARKLRSAASAPTKGRAEPASLGLGPVPPGYTCWLLLFSLALRTGKKTIEQERACAAAR
jgi:hypothetical protein